MASQLPNQLRGPPRRVLCLMQCSPVLRAVRRAAADPVLALNGYSIKDSTDSILRILMTALFVKGISTAQDEHRSPQPAGNSAAKQARRKATLQARGCATQLYDKHDPHHNDKQPTNGRAHRLANRTANRPQRKQRHSERQPRHLDNKPAQDRKEQREKGPAEHRMQ